MSSSSDNLETFASLSPRELPAPYVCPLLASWVLLTTCRSDSTCCCISRNLLSVSPPVDVAQLRSPHAYDGPPSAVGEPAEDPWAHWPHSHLPVLTLTWYSPLYSSFLIWLSYTYTMGLRRHLQRKDPTSDTKCETRACYSAELHVPRRTVTASASQTRIITILLCSLCTLARAS